MLGICTMDHLKSSELQKLLEDEAATLHIMHSKIANQIHVLQVEEELFRRELAKLQEEGIAAEYSNQDPVQGVNEIVEVTNEDVGEEGSYTNQIANRDHADGAKNIVEIASDDLDRRLDEKPEAEHENGAEGVNQIVEITDDEDEIMREICSEGYGQALTSSRPWPEQEHASNLEYEILEPSSDESETDVEDSHKKRMMIPSAFPTGVPRTDVGEKRQREEIPEPDSELNSEMEVEEDSDDQVSPARSPPRKKQTPRRKPLGS
ncbi:hypothetical protein Mapa_007299 [Marchantia paleacea]|nr:hypothetical protein Mapa_007299 [Marchantia paleacea]